MSAIFQVILSAFSGAIFGSLSFGLWLMSLMYIYILLYGSFSLGNLFLGEFTLEKPIFLAFFAGVVFGSVQGFIVGLLIKSFDITILSKSILTSFVITELLVTVIILFLSFDSSPITMIGEFISKYYDFAKTSLVMLVPTIITGVIMTKAIYILKN